MPPIVASQEHVASHPELQRTSGFTVLRAQYDRNNSNCGGADPSLPLSPPSTPMDNKVVGGHLVLGKRSSTPAGHHYALTATVSLLGSQHSALLGGKVSPTSSSSSRSDSPAGLSILDQHALGGGGANIHRRLDRSHSEPVWQQLQQQQQQLQDGRPGTNSSRYKTELCRPYEENGFCKYGDKCQFAHGGAELRTLNRHPKYKTELCRTFHTIGICPYGPRCHFIHNAEESRVTSPAMSALPMSGPLLSPLGVPQHHHHHNHHQLTGSPPPALVPASSSSPTNHHHHHPLTISPPPSSMGLPTIFDKLSPPSSISGGSPTSPNVFFDDANFPLFHGTILEGIAESFNALSLNSKMTLQNTLNSQFNNQINNHLNNNNNNNNNNLNNSFSNINENLNNLGLGHFNDLQSDSSSMSSGSSSSNGDAYSQVSMLSSIDTPPASPPDTSNTSLDDTVSGINSMRLPIFQSINSVQ